MPSNREMRKRIDEMVDMLGQVLVLPQSVQREAIQEFINVGQNNGLPDLVNVMSQAAALSPADLTTLIRQLRGQLLAIKRDQFGG